MVLLTYGRIEAARPRKEARMPEGNPKPEVEIPRLAQLVADGEIPFPQDLSPEQDAQLTQAVRILNRKKTVSFIARQIALAIHEGRTKGPVP
jgi:hypothetical protein